MSEEDNTESKIMKILEKYIPIESEKIKIKGKLIAFEAFIQGMIEARDIYKQ